MQPTTIYALGFFDGVHKGHGALLKSCKQLAGERGCKAGAITFAEHPLSLVQGKNPGLISTVEDRTALMKSLYGIEEVIVLPFDKALMNMPWQTFFKMLLSRYHAAGLVCGHDYRFGSQGQGTPQLLQQACKEAGIPCIVVPEQRLDGITISSTYIRQLLKDGDMERTRVFLGHPHLFTGPVVPGRHIGRTIGFPTANLFFPNIMVCPKKGVYASVAIVGGKRYMAVTNVGNRPTVGGGYTTVEAWLLDFSGDLYGQKVTLEFHKYLRAEHKFDSLEALRREIEKNGEETRKFFQKTGF